MAGSNPASNYNTSVAMEFFRFAGKPKSFAKGKKIFTENQRGIPFLLMPNRMYLLLDGEVGIFARDKPVGTVHPGRSSARWLRSTRARAPAPRSRGPPAA